MAGATVRSTLVNAAHAPSLRSGQAVWGWKVAAYLFLAGVGAGAYSTGAIADLLGEGWETVSRAGISLGPLLVLASTAFLIADLGAPSGFLRAGARPRSSWISRGVIILTVFVIIGLINIFFRIWPWNALEEATTARLALEICGLVFALLTAVYTGLLLGAVRPIPFWNSPVLPVLFLLSALSTGVMALLLTLSLSSGAALHAQLSSLARADALILGFESVVVLFYLYGCYSSPVSRPSAQLLLTGALAPVFWLGLVAAGLAIPLALELSHLSQSGAGTPEGSAALTILAAILGLTGGLMLRYLVVSGGVKVPLKPAGMLLHTFSKTRF